MQQMYQFNSPYQKAIQRMGGTSIFGQPVSAPIIASDGNMEQAFAKVVVFSPKDNPADMKLRPLARLLNMPETAPGPKLYDRRHNVIFYPVDGDLGYHVPISFDEFIAAHGGQEISGRPISETMKVKNNKGKEVARQCFENYCLEYDPSAPQDQRTQLADLGKQYADLSSPAGRAGTVDNALSMKVQTDKAQVKSSESQEFYVLVYKRHSLEPAAGAIARIDLSLPNGTAFTYRTQATPDNGWIRMSIPAMQDVPNGTVVAYKVCLEDAESTAIDPSTCVSDSYLIWNYQ